MITAITAVVLLSTSVWIITSKAEETKNNVYFASQEKVNQEKANQEKVNQVAAISEVTKQTMLNTAIAEKALIAKDKADTLAIEKSKKAKQYKIDKQVEASRLTKISSDKAKKTAQVAANKAKQEEVDRIAATRSDASKQAKIAENYRNAKATSDKAEQEAIRVEKARTDNLAKIESDRLAKVKAANLAKIEADRIAKVEIDRLAKEYTDTINKEEADSIAKIEAARLTKIEAERLAKIEVDKLAEMEADRLAKIEADRLESVLGLKQTVIGAKLATYLTSAANVSSVLNRAVELHGGNPSNTCVYFSSEALRRVGVSVPLATCNTRQYLSYLRANNWVSAYDIKKLTQGSICFTTPDWAGYPTHTFVFKGWVTSGDYTSAYVADNQGSAVHVRSMVATYSTDAFAFFMHN